jgi:outer membrane usher protein FimD/PapC
MRRHESIDFDRRPAGAYTLDVVVHDAKGRQRETDVAFQVVER